MTSRTPAIIAAWRHNAALQAAILAGRHDCWCGEFGPFRREPKGPWFCRRHVTFDAAGFFEPIPQS